MLQKFPSAYGQFIPVSLETIDSFESVDSDHPIAKIEIKASPTRRENKIKITDESPIGNPRPNF